ncbi:MAG: YbfB/YjiJ family MFS transporter [Stellaceae bacterium]
MRWWRQSWPGLLATLDGVGLCRFAYTPLIPFMIGAGVVSETGAAYLGAANLAGYLAGAASAAPLAGLTGLTRAIRGCFVLSIIGLAACVWPGGFWWYFPWRFLAGAAGAALMVLAPSFLLAEVPPGERGRHGGVIYAGVGAGIALSSLLVPPLAAWNLAGVWAALALGALFATLATWRRWRGDVVIAPRLAARARVGRAAGLVALAFGMDGVGFVPHNLFWVDYIARSLGLGTAAGAAQWLLLGVGAAVGPALAGRIGDGIGLGRALILAFAVKCLAVLLPSLLTSPPFLAISSLLAGALTPGIAALCAARITVLVAPGLQTRAWGFATLVFGLFQALGAYAMAFAYGLLHSYVPLYVAGAGFEALGGVFALLALISAANPGKSAHETGF